MLLLLLLRRRRAVAAAATSCVVSGLLPVSSDARWTQMPPTTNPGSAATSARARARRPAARRRRARGLAELAGARDAERSTAHCKREGGKASARPRPTALRCHQGAGEPRLSRRPPHHGAGRCRGAAAASSSIGAARFAARRWTCSKCDEVDGLDERRGARDRHAATSACGKATGGVIEASCVEGRAHWQEPCVGVRQQQAR
jgi:hypothetical protein